MTRWNSLGLRPSTVYEVRRDYAAAKLNAFVYESSAYFIGGILDLVCKPGTPTTIRYTAAHGPRIAALGAPASQYTPGQRRILARRAWTLSKRPQA